MAGKASSPKWADVKRVVGSWGQRELLDLVQDLFNLSSENREFMAARFPRGSPDPSLLDPYRRRIEGAFYKRNGMPQDS